MYIYICACLFVYMYVCVYVCMHVCVCISINQLWLREEKYKGIYVLVCVCVCVCVYVFRSTNFDFERRNIREYMYWGVYVCVCVCVWFYPARNHYIHFLTVEIDHMILYVSFFGNAVRYMGRWCAYLDRDKPTYAGIIYPSENLVLTFWKKQSFLR